MYTYTIQSAKSSGEMFVIEWNGDTIHGLCGPLSGEERDQAIQDIQFAPGFEYDYSEDGEMLPSTVNDWQPPKAVYDPVDEYVYRDQA